MDATERRNQATREAAFWWQQLGSKVPAQLSREDREQFTQWLRESPLHVAEMLQIAHVHDALGRFKLWGDIGVEGFAEPDSATVVSMLPPNARPAPRGSALRARVAFASAAVIAVIAVAAGYSMLKLRGELITTERAERREVMLNDGSIVKLEPETRLRITLDAHSRRVTLEGGRALFQIAKDPRRPFSVDADNATIRALGTAFGVERKEQGVVVTVSEGKVAVLAHAQPDATPRAQASTPTHLRLATRSPRPSSRAGRVVPAGAGGEDLNEVLLIAGEQLLVQRSGSAQPVRDVDTARALAWTQGRLVFDSTPLAEVAREFNRYNHAQLRVDDPELARRPISGVFQASDLETLLAFIRAGARVNVIDESGHTFLIAPAP